MGLFINGWVKPGFLVAINSQYDSSLFVGFMTVHIYIFAYKGYAPDLSRQNFLHFGTEGLVSTFFGGVSNVCKKTSTKSTFCRGFGWKVC